MECKTCIHWTRTKESDHYLPEDEDGICSGLQGDNCIIEVYAGWDGGGVGDITTGHDFYCANYEDK